MTENSSGFFGKTGIGEKAIEGTIHIVPVHETHAMLRNFMSVSGLKREQFASNNWGFPFIPIPEVRTGFDRIRLAPKEVSKSFLGHPIYWIEPELTKRIEGEGEQEWCIRMFFLIDAMGYWNDKVEFIDFLKVNDFSFSDAQIETYHRIAEETSETDHYFLLNEKNILTSLEDVQRRFEKTALSCFEIQKRESAILLQNQGEQFDFAKKVLGKEEDIHSWTTSFDDPGSVWERIFGKNLIKISREYDKRSAKGNEKTVDLLKMSRKLFDTLQETVQKMNHASSILEIPVKASIEGRPGGAKRISYMAYALEEANKLDNIRKTIMVDVDEAIKKSIIRGNQGEGGYDPVVTAMRKAYSDAWNRLRLAYINYERLQDSEPAFVSKIEMESYLQSGDKEASIASGERLRSDSLESILDQDFTGR